MKQAVRINFSSRGTEITLWPLMALLETSSVDICRPHQRRCVSVGPNGKPVLSRKTDSLGLCFNLSHSHGLAMLAVALGREVGIDVERIRPGIADESRRECVEQDWKEKG